MEEEIEIISPIKINYKKIFFIFFAAILFSLVMFFSVRAYNITKKVIVAKSLSASPYLSQGTDFINDVAATSILKEGDRRINILILGIGGGKHDGPNLTDTIMVISIDPLNKKVVMLSIPRDLYVKVEGFGSHKINSVYSLGDSYYKGGEEKFQLVKDTISDILGIPIHYFVLVDFDGFKKAIDLLGGVEVEVEEDIYDPYYPDENLEGYEEFAIKKGIHLMDGETALKYVRSRETTSDFSRAARQQDVITTLAREALAKENFLNIRKITSFINILSNNVKTDLQVSEIDRLIKIIKEIKKENVSHKVIDDSAGGLVYADNYEGAYVLLPYKEDFSEIHNFAREYFKDPFIDKENARIAIRNGTSWDNIAKNLAEELSLLGYNIVDVTNAEKRDYKETFLYDYSGGEKKFTTEFLQEKLKGAVVIKLNDKNKRWDIEVILGEDYKIEAH